MSIFDRVYFPFPVVPIFLLFPCLFLTVSIFRVYYCQKKTCSCLFPRSCLFIVSVSIFPCLFSKNGHMVFIFPCPIFKGIANIVENGSGNRRGNRRSARVSIFQNHRKYQQKKHQQIDACLFFHGILCVYNIMYHACIILCIMCV